MDVKSYCADVKSYCADVKGSCTDSYCADVKGSCTDVKGYCADVNSTHLGVPEALEHLEALPVVEVPHVHAPVARARDQSPERVVEVHGAQLGVAVRLAEVEHALAAVHAVHVHVAAQVCRHHLSDDRQ
eukprot:4481381-Pyramimonas_sp.AAC.1